jgi:translocation and assembly module TamB
MSSKKTLFRILTGIVALVLILAAGGVVYVHTDAFKRLVMRGIANKTEQSTGEQLSIGKMEIHWSQLRADLYDVVLRKPSTSFPPFFSCAHLAVSVKILSLWKRELALNEVAMDQPVLHVVVTAEGQSNLPRSTNAVEASQSATPSASTANKIFSIGIRHLVVTSGEIDWNDRQYPASADLHDLHATAGLNLPEQAYHGSIAYDRGRLSAPHVLPFEHDLRMEFVATRSALDVTALRVTTGRTRLSFQGTLADYDHPQIRGTYEATVFTPDLERILKEPAIPSAQVQLDGTLRYKSGSNEPFLDAIYAKGDFVAQRLLAHVLDVAVEARQVRASYVLEHGDIRVPHLTGHALGGSLDASFSMRDLAGRQKSQLSARVRGASLAQLMRFSPSKEPVRMGLAGRTDAEVQAAWAGSISNAVAHIRARIYGPLHAPSPGTIPVNGFLDVRYNGLRDTADFGASDLRTENTEVSFRGILGKKSSLRVTATANQLSEISALVSALTSSNSGSSTLDSLRLGGSAKFTGQVEGSPKSPDIQGRFEADRISVKGIQLSAVAADIDLSASGISVQNASLKGAMSGQVTLNGHVGLRHWTFAPSSPMSLEVKATSLSLPDLMRMADLKYPFNGRLETKISVHGTEENPEGQADISVSQTSPQSGNPVSELVSPGKFLAIHLQGDGNLVHATAQLNTPAGRVSATLAYAPKSEHYEGQINVPSLDLSELSFAEQHGLTLAGTGSFSASGSGTIEKPEAEAKLEVPSLQIQGETISALRMDLKIDKERANFGMNSTVQGGYVQAKGDVMLRGEFPATASLDVSALPIGPLLAAFVSRVPEDVQGETELHAKLSGPLKSLGQIKAQVEIPTLNVAYEGAHLDLAAPMELQYADGLLSVSRAEMKGNGTSLTLQGTIPIRSARPLNVSANGSFDLRLLEDFMSGASSSGRLMVNVTAQGEIAHPTMHGDIQIASATFLSARLPIGIESLNGKIRISGTRLEIEKFQGTLGGGNLSATGSLEYGRHPRFNLAAHANSVRVRYPTGLRAVLNGDLSLTGSTTKSTLSGRVLIDRLSFTQQFDMATLIGEFEQQLPSSSPSPFEEHMKLNVAVASGSALNLASSKLTIGGNFALTVSGTAANPVILGRVALTQGEVFFLGKRYEIQSGTIEFSNPARTEPVLNIYAKTTVSQYNITLNFVGPVDRLRTNYTSTPPLSEANIIHLIAFGTTAEQAATTPGAPADVAAESILAQGVSSQISGKLEKLTGISQITIDPLVTNTQANPGSQIAIQQRVSGSLLLTFSTSVTNTQGDTVEVQYTTPQNIRISVLRDYNGGYALDVRFRKTF